MDTFMKVLTLSSNASKELFPENTPSNFDIQLPGNGLELDDDGGVFAWYVALARLSFPKSWSVLDRSSDETVVTVRIFDRDTDEESKGSPFQDKIVWNKFTNETDLINALNQSLEKTNQLWGGCFSFKLYTDDRIHLEILPSTSDFLTQYSRISVLLHESLLKILGFAPAIFEIQLPVDRLMVGDQHILKVDNIVANRPPDINAGQYVLCIYSDIIRSSVLGDSKTPLLAVVSASGEFGKHITVEPVRLDFIPINSARIQRVNISIKSISGIPVTFERGQVTVTLHLKRILKI